MPNGEQDDFATLNWGDRIRVKFGSKGSQLAVTSGVTPQGNLRAYKWSAKSREWTKNPVRIDREDFVSITNDADFEKNGVKGSPWPDGPVFGARGE